MTLRALTCARNVDVSIFEIRVVFLTANRVDVCETHAGVNAAMNCVAKSRKKWADEAHWIHELRGGAAKNVELNLRNFVP